MMSSFSDWLAIIKLCALGAIFGLIGGIVRVLRKGVRGWLDLLTQMIVSAFCGVLAFTLLSDSVSELALVGICGIAGNSGGMLLDAIRFKIIKEMYK